MKSQALKQIHALLYEVRNYLCKENLVPSDAFATYDSQAIRPSHVHRSKRAHKHVLDLLVAGIERALRSDPPPEPTAVPMAAQRP